MSQFSPASRTIACLLAVSMSLVAQCPPPGGYGGPSVPPPGPSAPPPPPPPPPITRWVPGRNTGPNPASPATPNAPRPSAPAPSSGPTTPRGPVAGAPSAGGRTGPRGVPMTFERGDTTKSRLKVDWAHPVPPQRSSATTEAAGPLPLAEALDVLWEGGDQRPLLVLRECSKCKDSDEAVLARALDNERTKLLMSWFRTVRLPAHVAEAGHPFFNVFDGHGFAHGWPHFFLLAHRDAKPVTFTATQTPPQLWKGMFDVLEQRYAKDAQKALKEWLSLLETFDRLDARKRDLEDRLAEARIADGPDSSRAKKLAEQLQQNAGERVAALAREKEIIDLGLLPMPRKVADAIR
jgi:hypothetical protein